MLSALTCYDKDLCDGEDSYLYDNDDVVIAHIVGDVNIEALSNAVNAWILNPHDICKSNLDLYTYHKESKQIVDIFDNAALIMCCRDYKQVKHDNNVIHYAGDLLAYIMSTM
jgi:hypothetical protein